QVTFGLTHEGLRVITRVLLNKEPGARRPDNVHRAEPAMQGFAEAFAWLGRMANKDNRPVLLGLERPERVEELARLIGAVHVDIPKKTLDGIEDHQPGLEALEFGFEERQMLQGKGLLLPLSIEPVGTDMDTGHVSPTGIEPGPDGLHETVFPRHNEDIGGLSGAD